MFQPGALTCLLQFVWFGNVLPNRYAIQIQSRTYRDGRPGYICMSWSQVRPGHADIPWPAILACPKYQEITKTYFSYFGFQTFFVSVFSRVLHLCPGEMHTELTYILTCIPISKICYRNLPNLQGNSPSIVRYSLAQQKKHLVYISYINILVGWKRHQPPQSERCPCKNLKNADVSQLLFCEFSIRVKLETSTNKQVTWEKKQNQLSVCK